MRIEKDNRTVNRKAKPEKQAQPDRQDPGKARRQVGQDPRRTGEMNALCAAWVGSVRQVPIAHGGEALSLEIERERNQENENV
jgi:hypothetical protein